MRLPLRRLRREADLLRSPVIAWGVWHDDGQIAFSFDGNSPALKRVGKLFVVLKGRLRPFTKGFIQTLMLG
jgi:hypothetical protein